MTTFTTALHRRLAFLDGDPPGSTAPTVQAFEVVFLLLLLTEYWARALPKWGQLAPAYEISLVLASVLCPAGLYAPARRWAFAALALLHAQVLWAEFPAAGNHAYLELMLCLLCAGLDLRCESDRVLFLRAVRWLVVLILFWSGVQKLVHGYWTRGQYLAFSLWIESFRPVIEPLIPADDYTRLLSYEREVGDGPYLVSTPLLAVVSNAVCWAEVLVAPLLAWRRTRVVGVAGALVLLVAIQAGARELFFGSLMTALLLLCLRGDALRKATPAFIGVFVAMLLSRLGILPEATFY